MTQRVTKIKYTTLFGKIPLLSSYLWCKTCSCNTSNLLGIRHEGRSPATDAALVDFGSEHAFDEAANIFARHYKFRISESTVRRVTEFYGKKSELFIQNKLAEFEQADEDGTSTAEELKNLFLEFDGCSIRTGKLEPEKSQDANEQKLTPSGRVKCIRKEEWRDVRIGCAKKEGEDAKKWFIGGMKSYPLLVKDLFNLSLGLGMNENTKPVATSDGGNGLYEALNLQFCELQFILDFYHFNEHLYDTAKEKALQNEDKKQWVNHKMDLAWEGKADELIKELDREYEKTENDRIRILSGYVRRFKDCIYYKHYLENNFSIGSGEIESAHKYITQRRLKLSGACWRPENINPMLAIRLIKQNEWWDELWETVCLEVA